MYPDGALMSLVGPRCPLWDRTCPFPMPSRGPCGMGHRCPPRCPHCHPDASMGWEMTTQCHPDVNMRWDLAVPHGIPMSNLGWDPSVTQSHPHVTQMSIGDGMQMSPVPLSCLTNPRLPPSASSLPSVPSPIHPDLVCEDTTTRTQHILG